MSESEFPKPEDVTVGQAFDQVLQLHNHMQSYLASGDYRTAADIGLRGVLWASAVAGEVDNPGEFGLIRALVASLQMETAAAQVALGDVEAALNLLSDAHKETEALQNQLGGFRPVSLSRCRHGLPSYTGSCMRNPCPPAKAQ